MEVHVPFTVHGVVELLPGISVKIEEPLGVVVDTTMHTAQRQCVQRLRVNPPDLRIPRLSDVLHRLRNTGLLAGRIDELKPEADRLLAKAKEE